MSLVLENGTQPPVSVKTFDAKKVLFGGYLVSMTDFLAAAEYVLTNTDLEPNDLRQEFVERVRSAQEVPGHLASVGGESDALRILLPDAVPAS